MTTADSARARNARNFLVLGGCLLASQVFEIVKGRTRPGGPSKPDQRTCCSGAALDSQHASVLSDRHFVAWSDAEATAVLGGENQTPLFVEAHYPTQCTHVGT